MRRGLYRLETSVYTALTALAASVIFYFGGGGGGVFRDKLSAVLVPSPRLALSLRVANLTISRDKLLLHRGNPYELTDTG